MKRLLFTAAIAATTLAACTDSGTGSKHDNHDSTMHNHATPADASLQSSNDMQRIMGKIMADMRAMNPSGNPDHDFAAMMISHHQGAIEMAKAELVGGIDAQIRKMAQDIVAAQEKEIAEMQHSMAALPAGKPGTNAEAYEALMGSMGRMMHSAPASGKPDRDFVQAMIPHHEGAVEMAKVELRYGRDAKLKAMAQKIIDDQTREIAEMKAWLQANP